MKRSIWTSILCFLMMLGGYTCIISVIPELTLKNTFIIWVGAILIYISGMTYGRLISKIR